MTHAKCHGEGYVERDRHTEGCTFAVAEPCDPSECCDGKAVCGCGEMAVEYIDGEPCCAACAAVPV